MVAPDIGLSDSLGTFLDQWRSCLERWLETGTAVPSATARLALERLLESEGMDEWSEVRDLADILLNEKDGTANAAALLDLLVWLETAQRLYDADSIEGVTR